MKRVWHVIIYLGLCHVVFAADISTSFSVLYSEFKFEPHGISLQFPASGVRYRKIIDGVERGISDYHEKLTIAAGHSLQLKSRGVSWTISVLNYQNLEIQVKDKLKGIAPFTNIICVINESVDRRPVGGQKITGQKIVLSTLGMDANRIKSLVDAIQREKSFSVKTYNNAIVLEAVNNAEDTPD
ncbi:MAG: hypothetical protein PHQ27_02875 [Victivallales bacterium]|nr:hypothetical protein [Victivallales bacterium]